MVRLFYLHLSQHWYFGISSTRFSTFTYKFLSLLQYYKDAPKSKPFPNLMLRGQYGLFLSNVSCFSNLYFSELEDSVGASFMFRPIFYHFPHLLYGPEMHERIENVVCYHLLTYYSFPHNLLKWQYHKPTRVNFLLVC